MLLTDLPDELLAHVISFLNARPPSEDCEGEVPDVKSLTSAKTPLKDLSVVCRSWRRIVFPYLYRHLKVRLKDVQPPPHYCEHVHLCRHQERWPVAAKLVQFASRNELATLRPTVVIYQETDCRSIAALGYTSRWQIWQTLLSALRPSRLIIIAPPQVLGDIMSRDVDMADAWAFKTEYQRLELSLEAGHLDKNQLHDGASYTTTHPSPFHLRPWTRLTYHGGSCLPVFGEYHYFEKQPPCLLAADRLYPRGGLRCLSDTLTHLTYSAVFPHLIHMQQLVRAIASLTKLESLTMQLTPTPRSTMLDDVDFIGRGNLNLRDCWTEVERSYAVLVSMCHRAGSPIPDTFLPSTRGLPYRTAVSAVLLPALSSFTSLDHQRGILAKELDDDFARFAPLWAKESEKSSCWTRIEITGDAIDVVNGTVF